MKTSTKMVGEYMFSYSTNVLAGISLLPQARPPIIHSVIHPNPW